MSAVFADAFYFVARLHRHDQHHKRALAFSRDFRAHLLTTDWVLMEVSFCKPCGTWWKRRGA